MQKLKTTVSFFFSRLFLAGLMIVIQVALLLWLVLYFSGLAFYLYLGCHALSFLVVLAIISNDENPSYKMTWIIAILAFPAAGGAFYLAIGNKRSPKSLLRLLKFTVEDVRGHFPSNGKGETDARLIDRQLILQSSYIYNVSGFPLLSGTASEYLQTGECMFKRMKDEIAKAKKYIMLEFFIIKPGVMWDEIFDLLKMKIREGVGVYLIYDDLGCISTLPKGYDKTIRTSGINLCVFNPFRPRLSAMLNYRDHRKLLIIDGITGFCGGINLSDEYINKYEKHGYWKDAGVVLKGEAVWGMTLLFLQQWQFASKNLIDFNLFRPENNIFPADGFVQVFGDSPLDKLNITETAYMNIISRATEYVYITTPYLIIDYEMEQALCSAAQSGIDVRIITPYRYDKWYVHMLTRSHYKRLIECGVKIYEYSPGFIHGKMFVSDDNVGIVGTCNMDFRSFYLHFECGVMFYASKLLKQVKRDILNCQKLSRPVSLAETYDVRPLTKIIRAFLKIFAPLM